MIILGRFFKELVCVLYVTRKLKFIRAFLNGEEVTKNQRNYTDVFVNC